MHNTSWQTVGTYLLFLEPEVSQVMITDNFISKEVYYYISKGQLISECLFDVLNFPKNQQKIWQISALVCKRYNEFNTINSPYNYIKIIILLESGFVLFI